MASKVRQASMMNRVMTRQTERLKLVDALVKNMVIRQVVDMDGAAFMAQLARAARSLHDTPPEILPLLRL